MYSFLINENNVVYVNILLQLYKCNTYFSYEQKTPIYDIYKLNIYTESLFILVTHYVTEAVIVLKTSRILNSINTDYQEI